MLSEVNIICDVFHSNYEKRKNKGCSVEFLKIFDSTLHSFNTDFRISRVRERTSLSDGRVAQKDFVTAPASGSPGRVAQKAFETSEISFSEGRVAQNALVKLSSTFSLPGFSGLILVISPPLF